MCAVSGENRPGSSKKDLQVKPDRPYPRILQIQANHVIKSRSAAPLDLPQASDPRLDFHHPAAMPDIVDFVFIFDGRTRTHQRHFADKYIPKLRQFIQAGFAENTSDGGDARILLNLENWLVVLRTAT